MSLTLSDKQLYISIMKMDDTKRRYAEQGVFILVMSSFLMYLWGYHIAKTLLDLLCLMSIVFIVISPASYLSRLTKFEIAWICVLLIYPFTYYLGYFYHGGEMDLERANKLLYVPLIVIPVFLVCRQLIFRYQDWLPKMIAASVAIAGTLVLIDWANHEFAARVQIGTNLPLVYACVASAASIVSFWYVITHSKKINIYWILLLVYSGVIGLVSVVAAGARGAVLSIVILVILFAVRCVKLQQKKLLIIPLVVSMAAIIWYSAGDRSVSRFTEMLSEIEQFVATGTTNDQSMNMRFTMWSAAIEAIRYSPLVGVGNGRLNKTFDMTSVSDDPVYLFDHAHNEILQAWSSVGVFGLIGLLGLYVIPVWWAFKTRSYFSIVTCLVVFIYFLNGLTGAPLLRSYSLLFYVLFCSFALMGGACGKQSGEGGV